MPVVPELPKPGPSSCTRQVSPSTARRVEQERPRPPGLGSTVRQIGQSFDAIAASCQD